MESPVRRAHAGRVGGVCDVHWGAKHVREHLERTEVLAVVSRSSEGTRARGHTLSWPSVLSRLLVPPTPPLLP